MAGAKKYKTKTYRPPDEKFIVIVRPWGREDGAPNGGPNFARNIMAWCEIMIRGEHPGVRPNAVYTTTTRSDVIVEFPEEVDIQPYLGLHRWKKFLVSPYSEQVQSRFSSIYEYHYEHWDHPKTKGWSPNFPNYKQIHPAFPVKHPYPPSSPCPPPPPDIRFTKPLPPHLHLAEGLEQDEPPAPPQPTPRAESSTQASQALRPSQPEAPPASTSTSAFAPYERPSHLPPAPLIPSPPPAIIKKEEEDVKPSLPIRIKPEPVEPELGPIGNYTPSQELLEQLNQLPAGMLATTTTNGNKDIPKIKPDPEESARVMTPIATDNGVIPTIKPEPVEPSLSVGGYKPSDELMRAMGQLPAHLLTSSSSSSSRPSNDYVRVKPEPTDERLPPPSAVSNPVRVKAEPIDGSIPLPRAPPPLPSQRQTPFIKPEPRDDYRIPPLGASLRNHAATHSQNQTQTQTRGRETWDPRRRPPPHQQMSAPYPVSQHNPYVNAGPKRPREDEHLDRFKRIKSEYSS